MTTNQTDATTSTAPSSSHPAPPPSSGARLVVLLGLLGLVIGAYAYDYGVARPAVDEAGKKVDEFVDARNRMGVKEGAPVTPDDIHKELGMKPTFVQKYPGDKNNSGYEIEYYCWWGHVPWVNMRRHFLALVYIGDEPRRFSSHYKNEVPPAEALPIMEKTPATGDELPPLSGESGSKGDAKSDSEKAAPGGAPRANKDAPPADKDASPADKADK
jgi:hypothetical protein